MARWKLVEPHYLNVPEETWEYTENDPVTHRPKRKSFAVPRLLDPRDPGCWTTRFGVGPVGGNTIAYQDGMIIVCYEGKGEPGDQVFSDEPTPGMIPIDDEAREISAKFTGKWKFKPEDSSMTYTQSMVDRLEHEVDEKARSASTVGSDALSQVATAMMALVESQKTMMEAMASNARRV